MHLAWNCSCVSNQLSVWSQIQCYIWVTCSQIVPIGIMYVLLHFINNGCGGDWKLGVTSLDSCKHDTAANRFYKETLHLFYVRCEFKSLVVQSFLINHNHCLNIIAYFVCSPVFQHLRRRLPEAGGCLSGCWWTQQQLLWWEGKTCWVQELRFWAMSSVELRCLGRGETIFIVRSAVRSSLLFSIDHVCDPHLCLCLFYHTQTGTWCKNLVVKANWSGIQKTEHFVCCSPQCTQTCGGGRRTRLVVCQRPNGQRLNDYNCDILDKPPDMEQCNLQSCPGSASWHRDPWKPVW